MNTRGSHLARIGTVLGMWLKTNLMTRFGNMSQDARVDNESDEVNSL
jgi:hypothetical protein